MTGATISVWVSCQHRQYSKQLGASPNLSICQEAWATTFKTRATVRPYGDLDQRQTSIDALLRELPLSPVHPGNPRPARAERQQHVPDQPVRELRLSYVASRAAAIRSGGRWIVKVKNLGQVPL